MKKFDEKYTLPLMMTIMMPSMLFLLPAIILWVKLPSGSNIFNIWFETIKTNAPITLVFFFTLFPLVRMFIKKFFIK